jgi:hypothetical protein
MSDNGFNNYYLQLLKLRDKKNTKDSDPQILFILSRSQSGHELRHVLPTGGSKT